MSYILDALKKANAEREQGRGAAPNLYTQPVQGGAEWPAQINVALKKRNTVLLGLVAALFLCIATVGALFWPMLQASAPPPPSPPTPKTSMQPPPVTANAGLTGPSTNGVAPSSQSSDSVAVVRVTPKPYTLSQPGLTPPESASSEPPIVSRPPRPAPTQQSQPLPLPANLRAALPPLVISGSTYSTNPSYRTLIVNGQVYREGEFPIPELKLEQIRQKSALVLYKKDVYVLVY